MVGAWPRQFRPRTRLIGKFTVSVFFAGYAPSLS
jgi:hypothetical protein